jgi:hypothetical protein
VKTLFIHFNSSMAFESQSFTLSNTSHSPLIQKGKPQRHFDVKMKILNQNWLHSTSCYESNNIIASKIVVIWKTLGKSTVLGYLKTATIFNNNVKLAKQIVMSFIPEPALTCFYLHTHSNQILIDIFHTFYRLSQLSCYLLSTWKCENITFTCKVLFKIHNYWRMSVINMCENHVK